MTDAAMTPTDGRPGEASHPFTCAYCVGDGESRPEWHSRPGYQRHMAIYHFGLPNELPVIPDRSPAPEVVRAEAIRLIERAQRAVDDLCSGKLRWEMRVPAEPDHDPDLIIGDQRAGAAQADASPRSGTQERSVVRP